MMRGTFANTRIRNEMVPGVEGGISKHHPSGEVAPIYDAAMKYKAEGVPLVIFGGKEYGTGSSRDWAAKGTFLLGVKAVVAESFERIHRSNLVGMGVLPLVFRDGEDRKSLGITGAERIDLLGLENLKPRMDVEMVIHRPTAPRTARRWSAASIPADEVEYYRNGGILHYVLRGMAKAA
jgi:aconitate hydratase